MKLFKNLAFAVIALCLVSCGSDTITPVSENIEGPLGEYFQVVKKDYKVNDKQHEVVVEIKRIKDGFPEPWKKGMEVGIKNGCILPTFIAQFQDGDGTILSTNETDFSSDLQEIKTVAALEVNQSATVTFSVSSEDASQVKISSKFQYYGEIEKTVNLSGAIGKYPIRMTMHIDPDGVVTGAYYYTIRGPGNYLYIKGKKDGDKISLDEFTKGGRNTGEFEGTFTDQDVYKGGFEALSGDYDFTLNPDKEMKEIDFSTIDFSAFSVPSYDFSYDDSTSGSGSGSGWDDLLDEYDSYVTKYVSLLKKAKNGDISALAEYPGLLRKANEIGEKLQKAEGEMSQSQVDRYIKITTRLTEIASE